MHAPFALFIHLSSENNQSFSSLSYSLSMLVITNKIKIPTGISNEIKENKRLKKKLTDI